MPSPDDLLDTPQAAALLHVSPTTLEIWRSQGRYDLPFIKVGRLVRYKRSALLEWLDVRSRCQTSCE